MKTISRSDYYKLVGLLHLAKDMNKQFDHLIAAAKTITGDTPDCSHTEDAIWNDYTADRLLKLLHVTVDDTIDAEQADRDKFADSILKTWDEHHPPAGEEL